jgi:sensor histidine kinase YesM
MHSINLLHKKNRRKDENVLLNFCFFTMINLSTYFIYMGIKSSYTSDNMIIGFYTAFYIMNNIEVLMFYKYMTAYTRLPKDIVKVVEIVNIILFIIVITGDIINIFTRMYFTSVDGVYVRGKFMFISQGYQFVMLLISYILIVTNKALYIREKIAFTIYVIFPAIAIILQNLFPGFAFAYASLFISIEILFLFLNIEKNYKIKEDEKMIKDANAKIMVSQIQPHFVYNTLSSISTLITIDPEKAQKALDEFADYLRMNFSTLTANRLVSFEDELKHIETYVQLEKLRFNNRVNVIYDIKDSHFNVPPLSIQPLVENAIKHGILKKIEGGTVTIKTYETDDAHIVEVMDDGVGFVINDVDFKSNKHLGLNNIKYRITTMCKGDLNLYSEPNKGSKMVAIFYK